MDLVWTVLTFCFGIGLLVKGADWLVDAAARIAKQFGVGNFIIGLTIVAIGTSLPELGTNIAASLYKSGGIILGSIIGSNMANVALLLGLAGLFVPIGLKRDLYNRDGAMMIASVALFYLLSLDGIITGWEGGLFLFIFLAYIGYFVVTKEPYKREFHFRAYLSEYSDLKKREKFDKAPKITTSVKLALHSHIIEKIVSLSNDFSRLVKRTKESIHRNVARARHQKTALKYFFKQLGMVLVGAICIFFGANLVVTSAMVLPLSQLSIGMVFIALGTSLPELSVTISAMRKGLPEIMVGNIVGSNIANILWVGGIAAIINPITVPVSEISVDFVFLILVTWLFLVFLRSSKKISRSESLTLLVLYGLFIASAFGLRFLG